MKKKEISTKKKISLQLYLVLFLYTSVGVALSMLIQFVFPKYNNSILSWLYWRIDAIFIVYFHLIHLMYRYCGSCFCG